MGSTDSYTAEHVASVLHVKERTLREWRRTGQGPAWGKFGATVIYPAAEFDEWFHAQIRRPGQSRPVPVAGDHPEASVQ